MATQWVTPNGDGGTILWDLVVPGGGDHYLGIDDAAISPNDPGTATLIQATTDGVIDEFSYTTFTASSITAVAVYAYCVKEDGTGTPDIDIDVYMDSGWLGNKTIATGAEGWVNTADWTGTWVQADLDALQVRVDNQLNGFGGSNVIYELDVLVTFTGGATTRSSTLI